MRMPLRRILWIPVTVILITMIVFLMVRFIPGNVIDLLMTQLQTTTGQAAITRAQIAHSLGLDVPIYVQYGRWVGNIIVHGSFGNSFIGNQAVLPEIEAALPVTAELGILAIIISIIISIPIGVYSAIRQETEFQDYFMARFVRRTYICPCLLDWNHDYDLSSYLVGVVATNAINPVC